MDMQRKIGIWGQANCFLYAHNPLTHRSSE